MKVIKYSQRFLVLEEEIQFILYSCFSQHTKVFLSFRINLNRTFRSNTKSYLLALFQQLMEDSHSSNKILKIFKNSSLQCFEVSRKNAVILLNEDSYSQSKFEASYSECLIKTKTQILRFTFKAFINQDSLVQKKLVSQIPTAPSIMVES